MGTRTVEELKVWDDRMSNDPDVHIYSMGLFCASVCSRLPPEETVARVNALMEGCTDWRLSDAKTFVGGEPMPTPCERNRGRTHFLLE